MEILKRNLVLSQASLLTAGTQALAEVGSVPLVGIGYRGPDKMPEIDQMRMKDQLIPKKRHRDKIS